MKIYIIGTGIMAMALKDGLKEKYDIEFVARNINKIDNLKINKLNNFNIENLNIILAIKPYALEEVAKELRGTANIIYSVLAGISINKLKNNINSKSYIRAMPNISAKYKKSSTLLTGDLNYKDISNNIFSSIGDTFWLNSEKELNIGTVIAGSGPALLSLVAESMMDGLVKEGLKRVDAIRITNSMFKGFYLLLEDKHPAIIKDEVMSPSGITAKAYSELEKNRVRSAFMQAIEISLK